MINYVLGFYFDKIYGHCLLIDNGEYNNGIGGKIKHAETKHDAMIRECLEETAIKTNMYDWRYVMSFGGEHNEPRHDEPYRCHVFVCENGKIDLPFELETAEGIVRAYPKGMTPTNMHPTGEWIYRMIIDNVFIGHFFGSKEKIVNIFKER